MANANLHKAKDAKNNEFYTQLTDVSTNEVEQLRTDDKHRHVGILNGKEKYPCILMRKKVGA